MAPFVHKIEFPKNLAEQFSRGDKEKYNSYAVAYCKTNYPNMHIVTTVSGKPQDPQEQGYCLGFYKPGFSPGEIKERQAEQKKQRKGVKK